MREGADLARRPAGGRLPGERERAVAGLRYLPGQEVEVVDHVVRPHPADVLVEPHRPERHHLGLRVGVELGEPFQCRLRHARELGHLVGRVFGHELRIGFEIGWVRHLRVVGVLGPLLEHVLRPKAVADVGVGHPDVAVLVDEVALRRAGLDDVVRDVVQDREVGAGLEDDRHVRQVGRAVLVGRQRRDPHVWGGQPAVGHPAP